MKYEPDFSLGMGDANDEPSRHERRSFVLQDFPPRLVGDGEGLILFSEDLNIKAPRRLPHFKGSKRETSFQGISPEIASGFTWIARAKDVDSKPLKST